MPWRKYTGGLWRSNGVKIPCQEDHEGRLLLAHDAARHSRFREEMWQMPKIWECSMSPSGKNDDYFLALVVCAVGDRHYGSPTTGKEINEVPTRRNWLLHEVSRSESSCNDHRGKGTKFVWKNIVYRFRIPRTIISDNGRQFDNHGFKSFCSSLGIKNKYSSLGHPQANG